MRTDASCPPPSAKGREARWRPCPLQVKYPQHTTHHMRGPGAPTHHALGVRNWPPTFSLREEGEGPRVKSKVRTGADSTSASTPEHSSKARIDTVASNPLPLSRLWEEPRLASGRDRAFQCSPPPTLDPPRRMTRRPNPLACPASGKLLPPWRGRPAHPALRPDPLGTLQSALIDHCRLQPPSPSSRPLGRPPALEEVSGAHPAPPPPTPSSAPPPPPPPPASSKAPDRATPKRLIGHSSKAPHRSLALQPPAPSGS